MKITLDRGKTEYSNYYHNDNYNLVLCGANTHRLLNMNKPAKKLIITSFPCFGSVKVVAKLKTNIAGVQSKYLSHTTTSFTQDRILKKYFNNRCYIKAIY